MRTVRSFVITALIGLLLAGFTACGKVHPASQTNEIRPVAAEPRTHTGAKRSVPPTVVALNKAAPEEPAPAAKNTKADGPDLNPLNHEVTALETISQLKLTRTQLERLALLAPRTANKPSPPRPTQVSDEYRKTLKDLRAALLGDNEVEVADLTLALEELRDKENPDLDEVEITPSARLHAAEVLKGLQRRQVMGYLATFADEFPDPTEKLEDAYEEIRKLPAKEWEELRDEVAGQVGWLVAGLDSTAEKMVQARATELLNQVRALKEDDFTTRQAQLHKAVQSIVGRVGPTDIIRHFMERTLAELLSNPRLSTAVEASLKKAE